NLHAPDGRELPLPLPSFQRMVRWAKRENMKAGKPVIFFTIEAELCPDHSKRRKNLKKTPSIYVPKRTHGLAGEKEDSEEVAFSVPKEVHDTPLKGEVEEFLVVTTAQVLGQTARLQGKIELNVRDQNLARKLGLKTLAEL